MRLAVIAADEWTAQSKAVTKAARQQLELTPLRAWKLAPNYAPEAWYVEGYTRPLPEPIEQVSAPEALTLFPDEVFDGSSSSADAGARRAGPVRRT